MQSLQQENESLHGQSYKLHSHYLPVFKYLLLIAQHSVLAIVFTYQGATTLSEVLSFLKKRVRCFQG